MDYEERKKLEQNAQNYRTISWILAVVIFVMGFIWYNSDNKRIKWIHELQDEISEKEEEIRELKSSVEFWKEEAGR